MKKFRLLSVVLAVVLAVQTISTVVLAADAAGAKAEKFTPAPGTVVLVPSVAGSLPTGNLLMFSRFNAKNTAEMYFTSEGPKLYFVSDTDSEGVKGGYIRVTDIPQSHIGVRYTPGNPIPAGKYCFTGYFRLLRQGELGVLRIQFKQVDGQTQTIMAYPKNDWLKVEYYFETSDTLENIRIFGGPFDISIQDFCIDQFSLVPVDEIPADAPTTFGTPVTKEQVQAATDMDVSHTKYNPNEDVDIKGIIINQDTSGLLAVVATGVFDETKLVQFAKQFEGTHITDYFLSVNDQCSVYPSESITSYLDKYYQKVENGYEVDYTNDPFAKGSHYIYETLATDFLGTFIETFRDIGINPWLSFRMNDVHEQAQYVTSPLFTEFYHNHPEVRRYTHHAYGGYQAKSLDYTHDIVREMILSYINETLNRYDVYGIELDYQRELYLWHPGGEYNGLDILNDFMRQVDDLVAIYEEKYGHKIKIATRVAYDVETNYEFGLDVITWMAEGIVDMMIPASRYSTVDMDLPIRMWDTITESYGIELVASMEKSRVQTWPGSVNTEMDLETMAAFAASAYSQGADKVYIFNYYRNGVNFFTESDKINANSSYYDYRVGANPGMWNVLTQLGSYEKTIKLDRRHLLTYKDMQPIWESRQQYFPRTVNYESITAFRVPVGDVVDGSTLTAKIAVDNAEAFDTPPIVYVNSVECKYTGLDICKGGFSENYLMCYEIPEEVHDDTYMVIEITSGANYSFSTDHVEVYVKSPR